MAKKRVTGVTERSRQGERLLVGEGEGEGGAPRVLALLLGESGVLGLSRASIAPSSP